MHVITRLAVAVAVLTLGTGTGTPRAAATEKAAAGGMSHDIVPADQMKWGDAPPSLPKGARLAVVQGDPSASGALVTIRLKMPKGYAIPPHFHPTDEAVTVLSGTLLMGMGDRIDRKAASALKPGGWALMPQGEHHYAVAVTPAIVQVHMMGPFAITYVNPADDPQSSAHK